MASKNAKSERESHSLLDIEDTWFMASNFNPVHHEQRHRVTNPIAPAGKVSCTWGSPSSLSSFFAPALMERRPRGVEFSLTTQIFLFLHFEMDIVRWAPLTFLPVFPSRKGRRFLSAVRKWASSGAMNCISVRLTFVISGLHSVKERGLASGGSSRVWNSLSRVLSQSELNQD